MKFVPNARAPKAKSAFTLIELLVVIAIIAILAAILFPVFAKAREKARQASCASNEKQLGLGILQYVQDYDEVYPASNGGIATGNWGQQIYPYVKSTGVFACPDSTDGSAFSSGTVMGTNNATAGVQQIPVSYGMSNFVGASAGGPVGTKTLAGINEPASKILIAERVGNESGQNQDGIGWKDWDGNGNFSYYQEARVSHTSQMNVAFCDGHVKSVRLPQTGGDANGGINMWGCMTGSTTTTAYPTACTQGDINADNYDPTFVTNTTPVKYQN
jgi:prepilin-type N-terminal cleavage/methylation domain-containing protein/prepilin-type processing-associated H-X9-DG protein